MTDDRDAAARAFWGLPPLEPSSRPEAEQHAAAARSAAASSGVPRIGFVDTHNDADDSALNFFLGTGPTNNA